MPDAQSSRVTLVFNRKITPDEIKALQSSHDAIEAVMMEGHHDHDHPTIVDLGPETVER